MDGLDDLSLDGKKLIFPFVKFIWFLFHERVLRDTVKLLIDFYCHDLLPIKCTEAPY